MKDREDDIHRRKLLQGLRDLILIAAVYGLNRKTGLSAAYGGVNQHPGEMLVDNRVQVGKSSVLPVGVEHTHLFLDKHRRTLEQLLAPSPLVALEYFSSEIRELSIPGTDFPEPKNFYQSAIQFFGGIGQMCASRGQDIVVVNPQNEITNSVFELESVGMMGPSMYYFMEVTIKTLFGVPTSRRQLLKGAAFLGLFAQSLPGRIGEINRGLTDDFSRFKELQRDQLSLWWRHYYDWRDICTANGLLFLSKLYEDELVAKVVPLVQGRMHNVVSEYLGSPQALRNKSLIYPELNLLGGRTMRRYHFEKNLNKWILFREEGY